LGKPPRERKAKFSDQRINKDLRRYLPNGKKKGGFKGTTRRHEKKTNPKKNRRTKLKNGKGAREVGKEVQKKAKKGKQGDSPTRSSTGEKNVSGSKGKIRAQLHQGSGGEGDLYISTGRASECLSGKNNSAKRV